MEKQPTRRKHSRSSSWPRITPGALSFIMGVLGNLIASWLYDVFFLDALAKTRRIIIIAILTAIGLILGFLIERSDKKQWLKVFAVLYILAIPFVFVYKPISGCLCPFQADTPEQTMINIIHAEAKAAKMKRIATIRNIFAEDATITNRNDNSSNDPITHYTNLFLKYTFTDASHSDIIKVSRTDIDARFTSSSKGSFYPKGKPQNVQTYDHPSGSDEWEFGKDNCNCWVITSFSFR